MRYTTTVLWLIGAPLAAAAQSECNVGPGELYGVTSYQCANCSFTREGGRAIYGFNAEPTVARVRDGSAIQPGDVIESINGNPILTAAGAEQFTYPPRGEVLIAVRRNGTRVELATRATRTCAIRTAWTFDSLPNPFQADLRWAIRSRSPLLQHRIDDTGPFGLALGCLPSCARMFGKNGIYYRFHTRPPIVALRKGGIAELAGIQVGDAVDEVDGISIVTEKGMQVFYGASKSGKMKITVLRNGERKEFILEVRK